MAGIEKKRLAMIYQIKNQYKETKMQHINLQHDSFANFNGNKKIGIFNFTKFL